MTMITEKTCSIIDPCYHSLHTSSLPTFTIITSRDADSSAGRQLLVNPTRNRGALDLQDHENGGSFKRTKTEKAGLENDGPNRIHH